MNNRDIDVEICVRLINTYVNEHFQLMSVADFEDILVDDITQLIGYSAEDIDDDVDDSVDSVIREAVYYCYLYFFPRRSYDDTFVYTLPNVTDIGQHIVWLQSQPQPDQRTPEWYSFRHSIITASNLYKIFGSKCVQNELIYEKCMPSATPYNGSGNPSSSLHWGVKYEPVSIMIYEHMFSTTIGPLGCLAHPTISFIGASPDGINVNPLSSRYGRLLEIKNVKSREIDGNISEPYWIQMQIQMEVCNVYDCDFLETKFSEYNSYAEYVADNDCGNANINTNHNINNSKTPDVVDEYHSHDDECSDDSYEHEYEYGYLNNTGGKIYKGMFMYFHSPMEPPKYVYKPINITMEDENEWEMSTTEEYTSKGYQWVTNVYWKLVVFNCQLVLRNTFWFEKSLPTITQFWETIQHERQTGYEHRKPVSRVKKI
jgi:putative phage-type endonuclease